MSPFEDDFRYQERFYAKVQEILAQNAVHFIRVKVATAAQDMRQATDFVVETDRGDIALRIRREEYSGRYRDWTIRSYKRGNRTELHKILDGWARFYLYCWEGRDGNLFDWVLIDLDKVRECNLLTGRIETANKDGYTRFIAIPIREVEKAGCLVARMRPAAYIPGAIHWPDIGIASHEEERVFTMSPQTEEQAKKYAERAVQLQLAIEQPTWPREVYEHWIATKQGTAEQLARYAAAIAWYRNHNQ
jgi:hypothetical protein